MPTPVAVIVPVLDRPAHVAPLVDSYLTSGAEGALYFVADADDLAELDAIQPHLGHRVRAIVDGAPVTFPRKANLGYRTTTEPWLAFVGDDVRFEPGWAQAALRAAGHRFHLVATNDAMNPQDAERGHAVHPVIRRRWIDEHGASWDGPGTVAHEGYRHAFVDNEWSARAVAAGAFVFAPDAIVHHHHHLNGKAPLDRTYRRTRSSIPTDHQLWLTRSRRWG